MPDKYNKDGNTTKEQEQIDRVRKWYKGTINNERRQKFVEKATRAERFEKGDQWEDSVKALLKSQGKHREAINQILPLINMVHGYQQQSQHNMVLRPRRMAAETVAGMGTAILKDIFQSHNGHYAQSDAFRRGLVTSKGFTRVNRYFEDDPVMGDIRVESLNPLQVVEDLRTQSYDISEGEFVSVDNFITLSKLEASFPEEKVKFAVQSAAHDWSDWAKKEAMGTLASFFAGIVSWWNKTRKSDDKPSFPLAMVPLRETYYKTWERKEFAVVQGMSVQTWPIESERDREIVEKYNEKKGAEVVDIRELPVPTMHLLVSVGDTVMKYEEDPFSGMTRFPVIRYTPYWYHDDEMGVVEHLESLQRERNIIRNSIREIIEQGPNRGWIVKKFQDQGAKELLRRYGSLPGIMLELEKYGGHIEQMDNPQLPSGYAQLDQQYDNDIKQVSGINDDLTGTNASASESGRARLIRQRAGLTVIQPVLTNLMESERLLAKTIWEYVRFNEVYSTDELMNVLDDSTLDSLGTLNEMVMTLNDRDKGSYGVELDIEEGNMTHREAKFQDIQEMAKLISAMGTQLPPEAQMVFLEKTLELSDLPGKRDIIQAMHGGMQQMQQQQGQGGMPPEAAQPPSRLQPAEAR